MLVSPSKCAGQSHTGHQQPPFAEDDRSVSAHHGLQAYEDASRPAPGGGSVPGMPPSVTCSVHSDPDQYRCSCRPVGSTSQPGAIPVNVTWPDDASTAPDA
jgi:hypothetical protein